MPTVSFVMPAYNAGEYIGAAIESVLAQTYSDWELIVYDDASTDNTREVVRRHALADPRIRFFCSEKNSGNCLIPRYEAITRAKGVWISPLDADDEIEPAYLEQLLSVAAREHADIVYPTMWRNHDCQLLPASDFDYATRSGKDAMLLTLGQWQIGTNGGLIRHELYSGHNAARYPHSNLVYIDEVYDREVMYGSGRVAFSTAKYFYRTNESSVTRQPSPRIFEFLVTDGVLVDFIRKNYPPGSPTRLAAECHRFTRTVEALQLLARTKLPASDRHKIWTLIRAAGRDIRYSDIRGHVSPRQYFALKKIGAKALYFLYRYNKRN